MGSQRYSLVASTRILALTSAGFTAEQRVESVDLGEKYPSSQSLAFKADLMKKPTRSIVDAFGRVKYLDTIRASSSATPAAVGGVGLIYPEQKVGVNDSWVQKVPIAEILGERFSRQSDHSNGRLELKYQVQSISQFQVRIAVSGSGEIEVQTKASSNLKSDRVKIRAQIRIKGSYLVNRKSGTLDASTISSKVNLRSPDQNWPIEQLYRSERI